MTAKGMRVTYQLVMGFNLRIKGLTSLKVLRTLLLTSILRGIINLFNF